MKTSRKRAHERWGITDNEIGDQYSNLSAGAAVSRPYLSEWIASGPLDLRPWDQRPEQLVSRHDPRRAEKLTPGYGKDGLMSDAISREEAELRAKLTEAQTDKKFSDLLGEFKVTQATVLGEIKNLNTLVGEAKKAAEDAEQQARLTRWNTIFLVLGMFAAIVALLAFGGQIFSMAKDLFEMGASSNVK